MSNPVDTAATTLTGRGNQTNTSGQAHARASSAVFGELYHVVEHGWFADCLVCGSDIEHGDTCQRVLSLLAAGHTTSPTPEWAHEECSDNTDADTASADAHQDDEVAATSHPQPYALRSVEVSAMAWDGAEARAIAILAWVKASGSGSAQFGVDGIFLEQWPTQPLWIEPSMVLVRWGNAGWSVITQDQFSSEFRPLPR